MDQAKALKSLQEQLSIGNPHRFGPAESVVEEWVAAGSPHSWVVVQEFETVTLLDDTGYGWLALVVGDKVVDVGKDFVAFPDLGIVGLSPYYGLSDRSKLFVDTGYAKEFSG